MKKIEKEITMIELKIKRIAEKAVLPTISTDGNSFELTCSDIASGQGRDGRQILEYRTGLEIEIPEGYVGMLFLADNGFVNSLVLVNAVATFTSTYKKEIIARFKTNTDSIPAIYEPGEVFAKMIIIELPKVQIVELPTEITENKQEIISEENVQEVAN